MEKEKIEALAEETIEKYNSFKFNVDVISIAKKWVLLWATLV